MLGIVPARLASSRLPNKPLYPLLGRPLLEWVWRRVESMRVLDHALVATDSEQIADVCRSLGAPVEMTSVEPMARYAATIRRVLDGADATDAARFFDVHVAADGFHGRVALERLVAGFVDQYPAEAPDLLFGAAALLHVERAFSEHLLSCWEAGTTSLRRPLDGSRLRPPDHLRRAS